MGRWHSCNVLDLGPEGRRLWQFEGDSFGLNREQTVRNGEALSPKLAGKSWSSLWQKKLNIAWLPPENVFIRVAQFPLSTPAETLSMVELQLEKLSPLPVTQAVWSMHSVPHASGNMQTVIVLFAARNVVEEFLGKLEGQGYMADRLELPLLDQLQAAPITEDGAWIYPEAQGGKNNALVAWWYGGVLQNVDLLTAPADENRAASLKDQLMQMAWAGELEGWLTAPPHWHLVANDPLAAEWIGPLREGLEQAVEIVPPLSDLDVASRTARRAAQSDLQPGLLPPEFAVRYRQQFVDRLWIRGLVAVLGLYLAFLMVYFVAVGFLSFQTKKVEDVVATNGVEYTNSLQLTAQLKILKDRQGLKYLALECWEAVAETLPANITLDSMNFTGGKRLSLNGTAPLDQGIAVSDWSDILRKKTDRNNQPLFNHSRNDPPRISVRGGNLVSWSYELDLRKGDFE